MYNIVYSSSDEYAPFCLTSMVSLLRNNPNLQDVNFYILSNGISQDRADIMQKACESYNAKLFIINCEEKITNILSNGGCLNFNVSSFLRIFIAELLPQDIDKVLFIDSDTYVNAGIAELYNTDIDDYPCAMSYDAPIFKQLLEDAHLDEESGYFNAGVILFNLKMWRTKGLSNVLMDFYHKHGGHFAVDDQSIINGVLAKDTYVLDYKYNVMKVFSHWSYKKFCIANTPTGCKTRDEYIEAQRHPVIVHFNGPSLRPWNKWCPHPYAKRFRKILYTYYPEFKLQCRKDKDAESLLIYFKRKTVDRLEVFFNNI